MTRGIDPSYVDYQLFRLPDGHRMADREPVTADRENRVRTFTPGNRLFRPLRPPFSMGKVAVVGEAS